MRPTMEATCRNEDCFLDMVELHYTYELVGATADDFRCPACGTRPLEKLTSLIRSARRLAKAFGAYERTGG